MSIAVHHDLVYVANAGPGSNTGDTNYTGFRLDHGGRLSPIPDSTYVLPNDSKPGQVLFDRDGRKLVGTRIVTSLIDSFTVGHDGRLTAAPARRTTPRPSRHRKAGASSAPSSVPLTRTSCS